MKLLKLFKILIPLIGIIDKYQDDTDYLVLGSNLQSSLLCVAQDWMNGAPNETWTHSCRFASLAC